MEKNMENEMETGLYRCFRVLGVEGLWVLGLWGCRL